MGIVFWFTDNPSTQDKPLLREKSDTDGNCFYAFDRDFFCEDHHIEDYIVAMIEQRAEQILGDVDIRQLLFSTLGMTKAIFWLQDCMDEEHFSIATWMPNNYIVELVYDCKEVSAVFWDMRKMYFG